MAAGLDEIVQLALALPVDERAKIVSALLASLDDPADPTETHEAWTSEIQSRVDDVVSGRVKTVPRSEVRARLAADRAARRHRRGVRRGTVPAGTAPR